MVSVKAELNSLNERSVMSLSPDIYKAREVKKPWGKERVFAEYDGLYVGKLIYVNQGESLSLQYHNAKIETITIVSGRASVDSGPSVNQMTSSVLEDGDTIHLPAGAVHRITAMTDILFAEVSTAFEGWNTDVVRLEDKYGRTGTDAP
jgi:mannose-6-phosphate isomerase